MTKKVIIDIFDKLKEQNIKYAVCVAHKSFAAVGSNLHQKDFFVIIKDSGINIYKDLRFVSVPNFKAYSRDLTTIEFQEFKKDLNSYEQVINNKDGRVYEIK